MKNKKPFSIVRKGYDAVSYQYRGDQVDDSCKHYIDWLDLISKQERRGKVVDIGCGNGIPAALYLSDQGFKVIRVDISEKQIQRARVLVPKAQFVCGNIIELAFEQKSLCAVTAFYSIIHIPVNQQKQLLRKIFTWLEPGGYFICTLGLARWTGYEDAWLGIPDATMYWSHADVKTYTRWLSGIGFDIIDHKTIPEGNTGHTLFICKKPD
jgi:SAM-dependent methyltransferase